MIKYSIYRLTIAGTISILIILIFFACSKRSRDVRMTKTGLSEKTTSVVSEFKGRESCKECHQKQYDLFQGSDHDMAMDTATDLTVMGDFNDVTFEQGGITSRFFRNGDKFYVTTEGPNGEYNDYEIKYVFGIRPLQQYLIEFPNGRFQMLPFCWDTRTAENGGTGNKGARRLSG